MGNSISTLQDVPYEQTLHMTKEEPHLHQTNCDLVHKVVEFGTVEDSVMAEVMLEPACLRLTGCNKNSREKPGQPIVAEVPEDPPAKYVHDNNVGKLADEEQRARSKHPLEGSSAH